MKGSQSPAVQTKLFIDGEFVDAIGAGTIATLNPHDNKVIARVAEARAEDVDRAVEAVARAFPAWRDTAAADRGRLLIKLADLIASRAEELARTESIDTGHPIRDARALDVPRAAATFGYFGGLADKLQGSVIPVETARPFQSASRRASHDRRDSVDPLLPASQSGFAVRWGARLRLWP